MTSALSGGGNDRSTRSIFSPDAWLLLTHNLQMPFINCYQHLSTQGIDQLVDIEMQRLKANCQREEECYVEQMLLENPIIVERRSSQQQPSNAPAATTAKRTTKLSQQQPRAKTNDNYWEQKQLEEHQRHGRTGNGCKQMAQAMKDNKKFSKNAAGGGGATVSSEERLWQQRADSCRRSRINNKIKKAKAKYRHKFMSNKLMQSHGVLECMRNLIDQTETQLMRQGFNGQQLAGLRSIFCLDRN